MQKIAVLLLFFIPVLAYCQTKKLIWSDEFNYIGLPDSKKWVFEEGFVRNGEPQYYTRERLENAQVKDGNLIITAVKEDFKGGKYTSASITTQGKYDFTYGRVEVRAKLPNGTNVWPAIWTLGTNRSTNGWPVCGEIDIMEYWGTKPDSITANIHTSDYNSRKKNYRSGKIIFEKPWEDFHIYALEWYPDRLDFYFDDIMYYSCKKKGEGVGEWPFDAPQYLLINLALAKWKRAPQLTSQPVPIDDSIFPVEYRVDYVRIYKLN